VLEEIWEIIEGGRKLIENHLEQYDFLAGEG
jgi:hypothetical protein